MLSLSCYARAFPLTMGLGSNAGTREFHFCQLVVSTRTTPCASPADCLEFTTDTGPIWFDVHRTASLSESAAGVVLLDDMFQYSRRMSMVGEVALLQQVRTNRTLELRGYWYPSGRRLLLIDVVPADSR